MKFTLSWLKDHLETDASLTEIVDTLTMVGLEVEQVDNPAERFGAFKIAKVLTAEQHPDADRLRVLSVDTGEGPPVQVVCGAPNARAGLVGVFAAPGTYVPGIDTTLAVGNIRGVESHGMMCSERELEISDEHDGIIDIDENLTPGASFVDWAGLDDPMIEIGITPNRPDCLGVYGIARDLAAAGLGKLRTHTPQPVPAAADQGPVPIELRFSEDTMDACPAFAGRYVANVKNTQSPDWVQRRLKAIGLRPINALVDITNYLSMDFGRPLHVYDADKLSGTLHARLGAEGESFVALDGKEYQADEDMCVIADDAQVLGFGGIMGGENSGCSESTTNVLIECAYFDPLRTARTGRRTGINSDARYRFERGVDPAFILPGIELATKYVMDWCGGTPGEVILAGAVPEHDKIIQFPISEVARLTGLQLPPHEIKAILNLLGFWSSGHGEEWHVAVPSWRPDVFGKADIVEEVMRITGIDKVPTEPLPRLAEVKTQMLTASQKRVSRAKRLLAGMGFHEAITWSFLSAQAAKAFGGGSPALTLANPISTEMSDMRPSLLPGLLIDGQKNADRGYDNVMFFEVGQIFWGDAPEDQKFAATAIRRGSAGSTGAGRHWQNQGAPVSVYDAKADALTILAGLGMDTDKIQVSRSAPAWFHPGRSGALQLGPKNILGWFGELHPAVLDELGVEGTHCAFELILDNIPQPKRKATRTKKPLQVQHLQPVHRDFAFVVAEDVEANALVRAAASADKKLIVDVSVFDVFAGQGIADGQKSIAVEVTLQPTDKTLTDEQIDEVSTKVVGAVAKATGGELRH